VLCFSLCRLRWRRLLLGGARRVTTANEKRTAQLVCLFPGPFAGDYSATDVDVYNCLIVLTGRCMAIAVVIFAFSAEAGRLAMCGQNIQRQLVTPSCSAGKQTVVVVDKRSSKTSHAKQRLSHAEHIIGLTLRATSLAQEMMT